MRYQVPQFIEVEDKIFGPFTFKQFVFMLGGAGVCFVLYKFLPFLLAIPAMLVAAGIAVTFAFVKINSRSMLEVFESAFKYVLTQRLYIWKKTDKYRNKAKEEDPSESTSIVSSLYVPRLSDSKLKDLAWSLDINDTIYSKEAKKHDLLNPSYSESADYLNAHNKIAPTIQDEPTVPSTFKV